MVALVEIGVHELQRRAEDAFPNQGAIEGGFAGTVGAGQQVEPEGWRGGHLRHGAQAVRAWFSRTTSRTRPASEPRAWAASSRAVSSSAEAGAVALARWAAVASYCSMAVRASWT